MGPDLAKEADAQRRRPPTFVAASTGFGNAEFKNDMRIYTSSSNDNDNNNNNNDNNNENKSENKSSDGDNDNDNSNINNSSAGDNNNNNTGLCWFGNQGGPLSSTGVFAIGSVGI